MAGKLATEPSREDETEIDGFAGAAGDNTRRAKPASASDRRIAQLDHKPDADHGTARCPLTTRSTSTSSPRDVRVESTAHMTTQAETSQT